MLISLRELLSLITFGEPLEGVGRVRARYWPMLLANVAAEQLLMTRIFSGGDSGSAEWFSTWLWRTRDRGKKEYIWYGKGPKHARGRRKDFGLCYCANLRPVH
jgi:hypothetical protein